MAAMGEAQAVMEVVAEGGPGVIQAQVECPKHTTQAMGVEDLAGKVAMHTATGYCPLQLHLPI